jgi:hypothetical protein
MEVTDWETASVLAWASSEAFNPMTSKFITGRGLEAGYYRSISRTGRENSKARRGRETAWVDQSSWTELLDAGLAASPTTCDGAVCPVAPDVIAVKIGDAGPAPAAFCACTTRLDLNWK